LFLFNNFDFWYRCSYRILYHTLRVPNQVFQQLFLTISPAFRISHDNVRSETRLSL